MGKLHKKRKTKQHFVWRNYLRAWANNETIYCLMDNKIFKPNLMNIGQERYFYKLKELRTNEIEFLRALIEQDDRRIIRKLNGGWVDFFNKIFVIKKQLGECKISIPEVDEIIDLTIHNLEEDFHGKIEADAIKFLEMLYKKDLSFSDDEEQLIEFLFFICQQYFRTQNISDKIREELCLFQDFNIDAMWSVLRHICATNVGIHLYLNRVNIRPVLIENHSNMPFITSDQPIINTCAIELHLGETATGIELYYPLTPTLSLLLTDDPKKIKKGVCIADEHDVVMYNKYIYIKSGKQVYANEKQSLELFVNK
ncbi:DUF4238 domain-containing protein [Aeromonas veronii]|uniref:DUF4238 domain-containing protein n=1 Tax=Aeromonas veronii TaxID=654 RepID=UPI002A7502A1|nr:DUF4238 domain-containing protein [Aeromonas veronii]